MKIAYDKTRISGKELMFLVASFIHGSTLLSSFVVGITRQDTWFVSIAGFVLTLLLAFMYITIAKKFPGKNIISINEIVFGKVLGKIVSMLYVLFFFSLLFLNTREVGDFITGYIMPETPQYAITIMFLFVCAYTAKKGIRALARCASFFVLLIVSIKVISTLLLIPQMNFSNFAPAFVQPFMNYVQAIHTATILPYSEVMVFLMIFPFVDEKCDIAKPFIKGIAIGAVLMIIVCIRDWAVLGNVALLLPQLTFQTDRVLQIGGAAVRMEVLFAVILLILQFVKISVLLFTVTLGIAQIFKLKSYQPLVYVIAAIGTCFAVFVWDAHAESLYWGSHVATVYSSFFEVVIPLITLAIIFIREFNRKKKQAVTA